MCGKYNFSQLSNMFSCFFVQHMKIYLYIHLVLVLICCSFLEIKFIYFTELTLIEILYNYIHTLTATVYI